VVAIPFSDVQQVCGNYDKGHCRARKNAACAVAPCPFLATGQRRLSNGVDDLDRRRVLIGAGAAAAAGVLGAAIAGSDAIFGRAAGGTKPISGGTTTLSKPSATATTRPGVVHPTPENTTPQSGTDIGAAKDVPVGGAAAFSDPSSGDPSIVLQPRAGEFVAYDAVCPHAACTVGYSTAVGILVCPCHGSQFNPTNGAVVQGPATRGLTAIKITESGGQLFAG
jgi:thiosulfate dehydrogenase [quinone] large subunit